MPARHVSSASARAAAARQRSSGLLPPPPFRRRRPLGAYQQQTRRTALLVVGVHRSGTSALTHVLTLLGAGLPAHVMGPGRGNERGHFEPARIVALNEEIMAQHGADWWDPTPIPAAWFASPEAEGFVARAVALIEQEYGTAPLIALKDPRLCRLMPIYRAALERLNIRPCAILPLRHPAEVVGSLVARNGNDAACTELLWLRDLLEAEAGTRGIARVWTRYDRLLTDWRGLVEHIAAELGVRWPVSPDDAAAAIGAALDPTLRHFDAGRADAPTPGPLVLTMWDDAQQALDGNEARLRTGFDAMRELLDDADRLSRAQVETHGGTFEQTLESLQKRVTTLELALSQTQLRAATADADAALARQAFMNMQAESAGRDRELRRLQTSFSWRITSPLRALRGLLRPPQSPG